MGPQVRQLLATICVALCCALFALGGADPTRNFCLRTLGCSRPTAIVGPVLDMVVISHVLVGTSCEELEWCVNMGLLCPFTTPGKGSPLCLFGCNTMKL
jgi:hypothetical protein